MNKSLTNRARGDALGLVDLVLAKKEFKSRTVLDHVAPQAFGFAAALLVRLFILIIRLRQTLPGLLLLIVLMLLLKPLHLRFHF